MVENLEKNTIYNIDCNEAVELLDAFGGGGCVQNFCIVTDPPYNVGYHYEDYDDNMEESAYYSMLSRIIGKRPAVILHYPEALHKLSIAIGKAPDRVVSWIYNSNTGRQHRDIAFYGVKPDFSKVPQPYKNATDRRIMERIAAGKFCKMYDWFVEDQIKNVQKEKMKIDHPCVIPLAVMDKIVRLLPENLTIIDPFCGTGTTCIAAKKNGRDFIGMERSSKYFELAKRRLNEETAQTSLF